MGKIVLVPAAVSFEAVIPPSGSRFTGSHRIYPVMIHDDGVGMGLRAEVMIQEPNQTLYREDPLPHFASFFNIGRMRIGRRTKQSVGFLGWDMRADQVSHAFWENSELVELIEDFAGDVYLQIEHDTWKFQATHPDDSAKIPLILGRRKKHRFQATRRDKYDDISKWLYDNTKGDFDMDDNGAIYIRDETEAAHFKLRWEGEGAGAGIVGPWSYK